MTHYISAFNDTGRTAVCGVEVPEGDHSVEPTCEACQSYLSRDTDEDAPEVVMCYHCKAYPAAEGDEFCCAECYDLQMNGEACGGMR